MLEEDWNSGACCAFVQNIQFSCQIILKICTEHGSETVVLCANFQNGLMSKQLIMGKWYFMGFQFKINFGRIAYIATDLVTWEYGTSEDLYNIHTR